MRGWLALCAVAGCGAPDPVGPDAKSVTGVTLVPQPSIQRASLQVCTANGHVELIVDSAPDAFKLRPDPARTGTVDIATRGKRSWRIGSSAWTGDMSQALTIDGRLRDETPALWAKTTGVWLDTTGFDRAQLGRILDELDDAGGQHQLGALHLHLPFAAAFDGIAMSGPDEAYVARFVRTSQWVSQPAKDFAGAKFWWSAYQQGTTDHTGAPFIPGWHGEAAIGSLVLEITATGTAVSEAKFLELARVAIEAALVDPTAACRERSGHMGT